MEDLNDKITLGILAATEWNQIASELQNVIVQTGQSLTNADLNQLGKGVADYVSNGNFYIDSGIADAYVLTTIGSKQSITEYQDGQTFSFIADNSNAGNSTANVNAIGVKNIAGTGTAGVITATNEINIRYRSGSDDFVLLSVPGVSINVFVFTANDTYVPTVGTRVIEIIATAGGAGGGGTNFGGAGTTGMGTGGGAGGTAILTTSSIAASYAIVVGAGGAGGGPGSVNGGSGNNTSVIGTGVNIACTGGNGGITTSASSNSLFLDGAVGGVVSDGDINLRGGYSSGASRINGEVAGISTPGSSFWGGGPHTFQAFGDGIDAVTVGTGGAGSSNQNGNSDGEGGDGADGIVVIKEYL